MRSPGPFFKGDRAHRSALTRSRRQSGREIDAEGAGPQLPPDQQRGSIVLTATDEGQVKGVVRNRDTNDIGILTGAIKLIVGQTAHFKGTLVYGADNQNTPVDGDLLITFGRPNKLSGLLSIPRPDIGMPVVSVRVALSQE
jgi:hypothetical protein